ncbi:MAG: tRNA (adenosine(37)-N6)-dimethylallyltransferase MiaA, partial [Nitrospirota bacterium]|nr:tRNA (adenosine(37)-N6)-dimethylallyltransferase MiaA [Nitrospirota bacterium]
GEYSYEEAVRLLKRDTRHFAKRQMTWFQKEPGIHWITLEESDIPDRAAMKIVDTIKNFLETFQNAQLPAQSTSNSEATRFSG